MSALQEYSCDRHSISDKGRGLIEGKLSGLCGKWVEG